MARQAVALVCALVALGASVAHAEPGLAWRACGERLQCARVDVPFDWSRPGGRRMSLPVVRYRAPGPGPRIGSLFVNGGGAMGSVDLVRSSGAALAEDLGGGRFDVVGWALRGTSGARPAVRCRVRIPPGVPIPTTPAQGRAYLPRTVAYARGCGPSSLLAHVSTADDARDLDRLRELVGDRRLTYRAVSYGTFLGETYANLFPRRVRAMALDGVVDPRVVVAGTEARFADTVANTNAVLADFEALCESAGPDRCALAGKGPVAARVDALLARLRRGTIPAPTAEPPGPLTYNDVLLPFFVSLQDPSSWPQFAIDLDQAASGDGSALATAGRAALAGLRSPASDGPAAITCTDSPAQEPASAWPRVIGRLTRISPLTGPVAGWSNWAPCASWPARAADRYTGPWTRPTRRPILLVGTTADPSTPYANARAVARLLGNAALLTHDGYGHTSDADPSVCVTRATRAYLVDLTTPPPGTVCPSDRQPFDPDFGAPLRSAAGGPGA